MTWRNGSVSDTNRRQNIHLINKYNDEKDLEHHAIALAIFCRIPVEVHGQSFLKKLKQKVGNVVGTKDDTAEIGEEPFVGGDGDQPTRSVTPTDKLQKRRTLPPRGTR